MEQWEQGIVKTPVCSCLQCGARFNAAGKAGGLGETPVAGDLCICTKCGAVMLYNDDLTPRGMTDAEMADLEADTETMNELARHVRDVHVYRASLN